MVASVLFVMLDQPTESFFDKLIRSTAVLNTVQQLVNPKMGIITLILVCTFFITSADSAVIVLGIFSENGALNPSKKTLLMWGILEGVFSIVLMIGSKDALTTMETLAIVGAFPFIFVEIGAALGLTRGLRAEKLK
ncbi:MAG: BCCT family transporter [Clostridiales bacterium]|nr:BCCT family transporter [Candidatus Crickella caballi]